MGTIKTGLEFRQTLRAGPYAWPGDYPIILITDDGAVLCFDCARSEARQIIRSIRDNARDGWRIVGFDIHWYGPDEHCAHCGKVIPSAYGNDEEDE